MGSRNFPLRQSGIFHNLPTFDPSLTGLSAIICGASGISGYHALRALLDTPRWSRVFILSRKPLTEDAKALLSEEQISRVTHIPVDLLSSAEDIAEALRANKVKADYLFYFAFLQPPSEDSGMSPKAAQSLIETNVPMFRNLLAALPLADTVPKRFLLQTGGKNYGMHIGRVRTPLVESDPQPRHLQPNFYYHQEDDLKAFCNDHPGTSWNVIRPAAIIGSAPASWLTALLSFGIYAAVQAHKGEPLEFGGNWESWQFEAVHSSARLTGYLAEWAVLEPECANQDFNAQDGASLSWDRFFHELGRWFGVSKGVRPPSLDDSQYPDDKAMILPGGDECPLGYGPPKVMRRRFTLQDWAADDANRKAWEEIMAASEGRLTSNPWEGDANAVFSGDFSYLSFGGLAPNKARLYGWNGFVDTTESIHEMYSEMAGFGMLPEMKASKAMPLA